MEEGEEFEVEEIRELRLYEDVNYGSVIMYRIHWKGFGSEYDTWEREENLAGCHELLEEFRQKQKKE